MTLEAFEASTSDKLRVLLVQLRTVLMLLILCVASFLLWIFSSERKAEAQAAEFCAATQLGDSEDKVTRRLTEPHSERRTRRHEDLDGVIWSITFLGPLVSRHICLLKLKNDAVVEKETRYVD